MTIDRTARRFTLIVLAAATAACTGGGHRTAEPGPSPLDPYTRHAETARIGHPSVFIGFLRTQVYTSGELDNLPPYAIVLHDSRVGQYLRDLGYTSADYDSLKIGQTDPTMLYVVRPRAGVSFMVVGGLPGGGGIATQAAELAELGAGYIVHIGTAGLLGPGVDASSVLLSQGSYRDGAAVLLSGSPREPFSHPDPELSDLLAARLAAAAVPYVRRTGFTIPIVYFQPSGLIAWLLSSGDFSAATRPAFVEMEQAPLFEVARRMDVRAASIVAPTDRYTVENGEVVSRWIGPDADALKLRATRVAVDAFAELARRR